MVVVARGRGSSGRGGSSKSSDCNTYLARARSRCNVSSRPCSKSRKRMPSSPNKSSSWSPRSAPSTFGPSTNPAPRKPSTGEMLARLHSGTIATVAARNTSASEPSTLSSAVLAAMATSSTGRSLNPMLSNTARCGASRRVDGCGAVAGAPGPTGAGRRARAARLSPMAGGAKAAAWPPSVANNSARRAPPGKGARCRVGRRPRTAAPSPRASIRGTGPSAP